MAGNWITRRLRRSAFPWGSLVCLVALAVLVGAFSWQRTASRSDDLWFEVAKAAIQLVAIAVLGGAATAAFRSREHRRDERLRLDEFRAETAEQLWDAYHRIKAVRRSLRAAGFGPNRSETLTAEQAAAFGTLMERLSEAQLTLEMLKRTFDTQAFLFAPDGPYLTHLLEQAENYVNEVGKVWRAHGEAVAKGDSSFADLMRKNGRPSALAAFVGSREGEQGMAGIEPGVSDPIAAAARRIQGLRFADIDPGR
jgi:hypothetical protein